MRRNSVSFLFVLCLMFICSSAVWACRGSGCTEAIVTNGYMARGYGDVAAVLSFGVFYLQLRRCGFAPTTFGLFALFIPIILFNGGWHYSGLGGDAGSQEYQNALNSMYIIGNLLLWQIGNSAFLCWQHARRL